ncbi:acyltransferase family protein [Flavisolibacter nicotianae]|uniref:acyltransferase family protein n=1 Tax=Flavisolibacter nicotianae TaxID=2364882 RepID=UPI000EB54744|nr:acyltransferase [Flavisolibacter nicotianae]
MQALSTKSYYPGLDALRGIAVLSVIFSHFYITNANWEWGWMGVDLFFVISGFLITTILLRTDKNKSSFFRNFYIRRALRILPLCLALLSVFFLVVCVFDLHNRLVFYKENWFYYFLFLENWLFVFKRLPQEYYLNHLWSLAVEEQFYLFFPILVYFVSRKKLTRLILFLLPVVFCLRTLLWHQYPDQFAVYYCNTFTRIDSILFGALLGCGYRIRKAPALLLLVTSLGVLFAGILTFRSASMKTPFMATIGYSLIALVAYLFLLFFTQSDTSLSLLRNNRILNFIGKISYGVYLLHLPINLVTVSLCAKFFGAASSSPVVVASSLLLTLLISTISFYTLERYFLHLKKYFPNQPAKPPALPSLLQQQR